MLEELLAAEVLEVRVLHPPIAQSLVGKVISVLEDRQPRHQPRRQRRLARLVAVDRAERLLQKLPIDRPRQLHQLVVHVVIWSSRERNRSCSPLSRRSRGRIANPPLNQLEREKSRLPIRGNPQNRICKEIAFQRSKTSKFDYLSAPNQPAHSMAFEFFTDDYLCSTSAAGAVSSGSPDFSLASILTRSSG